MGWRGCAKRQVVRSAWPHSRCLSVARYWSWPTRTVFKQVGHSWGFVQTQRWTGKRRTRRMGTEGEEEEAEDEGQDGDDEEEGDEKEAEEGEELDLELSKGRLR
eukprot:2811598-Pyramimonas_sp.AAC.1